MKENILVTGATGMVGSRFVETYKNPDNLLTPSTDIFDLTKSESVVNFFSAHPEITAIINFAAYTNVGEAQKQKSDENSPCYQLNVTGVQNLINQIRDADVYLIQISTDMIFPGDATNPGPYAEDHLLNPDLNKLTWYGYTKAQAEQAIITNLPSATVVRLIYPVISHYDRKPDYLRAPLAYYEKNHTLYPIFTDQQVNITDVDEACLVLNYLLEKHLSGVFHTGSSNITTPYEVMTQLFDLVYGNHDMVKPGNLGEFLKTQSDPTRYPQFGGLLNQETEKQLGIHFSSSRQIINRLYNRPK